MKTLRVEILRQIPKNLRIKGHQFISPAFKNASFIKKEFPAVDPFQAAEIEIHI